ncbi:MAG TPA: hypothetical protein VGU64_08575, partial [Terriglobales bacterium]|nr:hypothetical protein [Terriglobales bacterium]
RLEAVKLAIQHVRHPGEWNPVARVSMDKRPLNIARSETVDYSWKVNGGTIIAVHELVAQRLAERDPNNAGEQNADYTGD